MGASVSEQVAVLTDLDYDIVSPALVLHYGGDQTGFLSNCPFVRYCKPQANRARSSVSSFSSTVACAYPPKDVLVIPTRVVPRLTDLTTPELTSLMSSVQHVGRVIEKAYGADSLTLACQVVLIIMQLLYIYPPISRTAELQVSLCRTSTSISSLGSSRVITSLRGWTMYTPP